MDHDWAAGPHVEYPFLGECESLSYFYSFRHFMLWLTSSPLMTSLHPRPHYLPKKTLSER